MPCGLRAPRTKMDWGFPPVALLRWAGGNFHCLLTECSLLRWSTPLAGAPRCRGTHHRQPPMRTATAIFGTEPTGWKLLSTPKGTSTQVQPESRHSATAMVTVGLSINGVLSSFPTIPRALLPLLPAGKCSCSEEPWWWARAVIGWLQIFDTSDTSLAAAGGCDKIRT